MEYKIIEANSSSEKQKFIKCQWNFYQNDGHWVPPMIANVKDSIDTAKNPFYQHSEIQLFYCEDSNNNVVGRIAAIINRNHNKTHSDKVGFFGFFECINDQKVADLLLNTAAKWLKNKGMDLVRGPENPSMNDEIGLLIDGFDDDPIIMTPYNPPYYQKLIENNGFTKSKDLLSYWLTPDFASEKLIRYQNAVRERYDLKFRHVDFKDKEQFNKDVDALKDIYNKAWVPNWGFVKWTNEEFDHMAGALKLVANPELAIIVESRGQIVGFALGLPDINQCLKYNKNGGMLGAAWHLMTKKKKITRMRIIALGIIPEFQRTGIDAVLYYEVGTRAKKIGIQYGDASWILEDNMMMNRALQSIVNGKVYKKHRLFDKNL